MVAHKRVLVMDDEEVVCRSYDRVLTNAGFEVDQATSGREALADVRDHPYDVMLADLKMPGLDGMSVVRQLRQTHPDLPIIVITGYPSQDSMDEAARLGVADYMTKPVAPDVLAQATRQAATGSPWTRPPRVPDPTRTTDVPATAPKAMPPPATVEEPEPPLAEPDLAAKERIGIGKRTTGFFKTAAALVTAPILGLAYVVFLPFIGFAVVLGLGSKALVRKLAAKEA